MKTAISLPDKVFFEAETVARNLGISRSALYLSALREYLEKNRNANITQKLNMVYSDTRVSDDEYRKEFEAISNAGLESIRELTKDDSW